jgi:tryptophan-rich sensory protein
MERQPRGRRTHLLTKVPLNRFQQMVGFSFRFCYDESFRWESMKRFARAVVFIAVAYLPALFGAQFLPGPWYEALRKPAWTPPGWIFGPVWTLLYLMIGIAGFLAWEKGGPGGRFRPFAIYGLQLLANALWSWLFFGLHRPGLALTDLVLLWLLLLVNIALFAGRSKAAAWLLAPYLGWITFAGALNLAVFRLNS